MSELEEKPTTKVGNYTVIISPELGHGSFGQVLEAEHNESKKQCVVKKIELTKDPERYKRLLESAEREKHVLSRLSHRNIVKYIEVHTLSNSWWIFMERCLFGNLKEYLTKQKRPIILNIQIDIDYQCASAVEYLHSQNIIHRDIKLENFLATEEHGSLVIKLTDFGMSKLLEDYSTERNIMGTKVGTSFYRAPEQFAGEQYTEAVDIFALGLVFLVLLQFEPGHSKAIPLSEASKAKRELNYIGKEMLKHSCVVLVKIHKDDSPVLQTIKEIIFEMTQFRPEKRMSIQLVCSKLQEMSDLTTSGMGQQGDVISDGSECERWRQTHEIIATSSDNLDNIRFGGTIGATTSDSRKRRPSTSTSRTNNPADDNFVAKRLKAGTTNRAYEKETNLTSLNAGFEQVTAGGKDAVAELHLNDLPQQGHNSPSPQNTSVMTEGNHSPERLLCQAIIDGDSEKVHSILQQDDTITYINNKVPFDSLDSPKLPRGRDVTAVTALYCGSLLSSLDIMQSLIRAGASLRDIDDREHTVLHTSCYSKSIALEKLKYLANHDRTLIDAKDKMDCTALIHSSVVGHTECCEFLITHGADVHARNCHNNTAAQMAALDGHAEIIELLLKHGVDVDIPGEFNQSPAHVASYNGQLNCLSVLVEHGANVNFRDKDKVTPLMWSSRIGHTQCCEFLIKHGADVHARDCDNDTAAHEAALGGHAEIIELLLKHGVDVDIPGVLNRSPAYDASEYGHLNCLSVLVEHGANVNFRDEKKATPLIASSRKGHTECCEFLITHGADVHLRASDNTMAIHHAAWAGHSNIIELLRQGIDVNVPGNEGRSPLHYSAKNGRVNCLSVLVQHGARVNAVAEANYTPLMAAASHGHLQFTIDLIEKYDADINAIDNSGYSALFYAIENSKTEVAKLLASYLSCDIDSRSRDGKAPADIAHDVKNQEMVDYLSDIHTSRKRREDLKKNMPWLIELGAHLKILDHLFSQNEIDNAKYEELSKIETADKRMREVLFILLKKPTCSWVPVFIQGLRESSPEAADRLLNRP